MVGLMKLLRIFWGASMTNNKTLLTAIERKRKQIAKQQRKLKNAKSEVDRDLARDEIKRLKTAMLNMQNQIKMNHAIGDINANPTTNHKPS